MSDLNDWGDGADSWSAPINSDEAWKRAGGRRAYNARRTFAAEHRRAEVAKLLATFGVAKGVQAMIASKLGVSEPTISKDVKALLRSGCKVCPTCGGLRPRPLPAELPVDEAA